MRIKIDGEIYEIKRVHTSGDLPRIETYGRAEFILAEDSDKAGEVVAQRWRDMAKNDKREFRALIGDERLLQWAMGESDSFGIDSMEDFFETVASVPAEDLASYDGTERDVDRVGKLRDELDFTPTVAYRCN